MEILTIITMIGGVCGAIVTIVGFITLLLKKPKAWVRKVVKEQNQEDMKEIKEILKKINNTTEEQKKSDLALLRHEITSLYFKYKNDKVIPSYAKQDWLSMYERYTFLGGNSYIKTITTVMEEEWEER